MCGKERARTVKTAQEGWDLYHSRLVRKSLAPEWPPDMSVRQRVMLTWTWPGARPPAGILPFSQERDVSAGVSGGPRPLFVRMYVQ